MGRSGKYALGCALSLAAVSLAGVFLLTGTPLRRGVDLLTDWEGVGGRWGLFPLFIAAVTALGAAIVLWCSGRLEDRLWGTHLAWKRPAVRTIFVALLAVTLLGNWLATLGTNALCSADPRVVGWDVHDEMWARARFAVRQYVWAGEAAAVGILAVTARMVRVILFHREK